MSSKAALLLLELVGAGDRGSVAPAPRVATQPMAPVPRRIEQGVAAYRADYGSRGLFDGLPYLGILDALANLRREGARLYVATLKRPCFAVRILEHVGLSGLFDAIHGSEDGGALDRESDLIAHILAEHALQPDCCLMVGNRRYDIIGAKANGIRSLGVLWGYGTRDELTIAGADALVERPSDLGIVHDMKSGVITF